MGILDFDVTYRYLTQMAKDLAYCIDAAIIEEENMADKKWIKGAIKHPGKLHQELGVKPGMKIPAKKLEKAEHSKNPTIKKEAVLAKTLKGFNKKK